VGEHEDVEQVEESAEHADHNGEIAVHRLVSRLGLKIDQLCCQKEENFAILSKRAKEA